MDDVTPRRVSLAPMDCLAQGHELTRSHYWTFVGVCALGTLLAGIVPFGIVMGPLMCGIYLCFFDAMEGHPPSFETLFRGFDHFAESLIATVIVIGASLMIVVPLYLLMVGGLLVSTGATFESDLQMIALPMLVLSAFVIVALVLSIAVGVMFTFVYPLICKRGLKAIPALRVSLAAAWVNFWEMTLLLLLIGVITTAASLFCYLPAFLVLPACLGAIAVAYGKVFPLGDAPSA